jgi:hypothetical protein
MGRPERRIPHNKQTNLHRLSSSDQNIYKFHSRRKNVQADLEIRWVSGGDFNGFGCLRRPTASSAANGELL